MKRTIILLITIACFAALSACGNTYDKEIDQVIKLENKDLEKPSTETDIDTLKRDDTKIWVYEDGKYIKLQYTIRSDKDTSTLYKYDKQKDQYLNEYDGDFHNREVKEMNPDYTENVDDDS